MTKEVPLWLKYSQLQSRHNMRWMYRYMGVKVPKLSWEKDDSTAQKIEEFMDSEKRT